jgi:hypothetical protein
VLGVVLLAAGAQAAEPEARLTFATPDVNIRPPNQRKWTPASSGAELVRRTQVNTLSGASAEVTLKDGSALHLHEDAQVVIHGAPEEAPKRGAKKQEGGVELLQGELRLRSSASLPVKTAAAKVSAETADVVVRVEERRISHVAVFDGEVQVEAKGKRVLLTKGQGTRVTKGRAPEAPRALLPAPTWSASGPRDVVLSLAGAPQAPGVGWTPVTGAVYYRAALARDEAFRDVVARGEPAASAQAPSLASRPLPPGRYFARVQAVDALGLPGLPAAPRTVEVVAVKVERGEQVGPDTVRGRGEVALSVEPSAGLELQVDGKPAPAPFVLTTPGRYTVGAAGARGTVTVEVEAVAAVEEKVQAVPRERVAAVASPAPEVETEEPVQHGIGVHSGEGITGVPILGAEVAPMPTALLTRGTQLDVRMMSTVPTQGLAAGRTRVTLGLESALGERASGRVWVSGLWLDSEAPPTGGTVGLGAKLRLLGGARARLLLTGDAAVSQREPGTAGRLALAAGATWGRFEFSLVQGVGMSTDLGAKQQLTYDSGYLVAARLVPGVSLLAEVDGTWRDAGRLGIRRAYVGALGARLERGAWRLGLSARTGLLAEGRRKWGTFEGGLTLGYELPVGL